MKLIFNDATEIIVQQVESHGDYLRILTVGKTPEQLKVLFTDSSRTASMIVQERGQTIATYKGYTTYDHAEIYTGQIYGVVLYKKGTTTEERLVNVEDAVNQTNTCLLYTSKQSGSVRRWKRRRKSEKNFLKQVIC